MITHTQPVWRWHVHSTLDIHDGNHTDFCSCKRFDYWRGRLIETGGGMLRDFPSSGSPPQSATSARHLGRWSWEWDSILVFLLSGSTSLYCFPRHVSRRLGEKHGSRTLNWHSDRSCWHCKYQLNPRWHSTSFCSFNPITCFLKIFQLPHKIIMFSFILSKKIFFSVFPLPFALPSFIPPPSILFALLILHLVWLH